MKTSKPFSTISYNTKEFLSCKLNDLIQRRKISFWAFVEHIPEEDEEKAHKHLFIIPNGQVVTEEVLDYLLEVDPTKIGKPLGCIFPKPSKFADWYLYALHDKDYLASKGQARKYHYTREDIERSDSDYLNEEIHSMDLSKLHKFQALREAAENGIPFTTLILNGVIPPQQSFAYEHTYDLLNEALLRNGRATHTPKIDNETGEVLSDEAEPSKNLSATLCPTGNK